MEEILAGGGSAYLMPAVLFAVVLYVIRGMFSLHGRRSQHRKEFLELWNADRSQDDLWLEVAVRHLTGTYLPASVIRLALTQPDKTQSLLDLSELWPLVRFESTQHTICWKHKRNKNRTVRNLSRVMLLVGYFACALILTGAAWGVAKFGPGNVAGWVYGLCAIGSGFMALVCLIREDTYKAAVVAGEIWLSRINSSARHSDQFDPTK